MADNRHFRQLGRPHLPTTDGRPPGRPRRASPSPTATGGTLAGMFALTLTDGEVIIAILLAAILVVLIAARFR